MNNIYEEYDNTLKIVILGESAVGKSSLILRFVDNAFNVSFISTIGVDFKKKIIRVGNKNVRLQIWDTAGQERFRAINNTYYRGANGVILVYDVTNRESFDRIEDWKAKVDKEVSPKAKTILIGNKCDLLHERVIKEQEGRDLAEKLGVKLFESSAKNGDNVKEMFHGIAESLLNSVSEKKESTSTDIISLDVESTSFSSRGCGCRQN